RGAAIRLLAHRRHADGLPGTPRRGCRARPTGSEPMSEAFVKVRDLRKTYEVRRGLFGRPRPLHAVAGVSFEVPAGFTFGLVGESGSGKSTIAKMLMLAEPATAGAIEIGRRDPTRLDRKAREQCPLALQPRLQAACSSPYP